MNQIKTQGSAGALEAFHCPYDQGGDKRARLLSSKKNRSCWKLSLRMRQREAMIRTQGCCSSYWGHLQLWSLYCRCAPKEILEMGASGSTLMIVPPPRLLLKVL